MISSIIMTITWVICLCSISIAFIAYSVSDLLLFISITFSNSSLSTFYISNFRNSFPSNPIPEPILLMLFPDDPALKLFYNYDFNYVVALLTAVWISLAMLSFITCKVSFISFVSSSNFLNLASYSLIYFTYGEFLT